MNYKHWNKAMVCWILAVLTFVAAMNVLVDPYGYFSYQSGDYADISSADVNDFLRELKAEHIVHFGKEYDAFLLGGSKAGAFRPEKLQELDGYRYYNLFEVHGNFTEYEVMTNFLMKYANPKKIVIALSGSEVNQISRDQNDLHDRIPAVVSGKPKILEIADLLFKDVSVSFQELKERGFSPPAYEGPTEGERDLSRYYPRMQDDAAWESYTKTSVLATYDKDLKQLFKKNPKSEYYQEILDSLRRIKKICDKNDTQLQIIVTPSFFTRYKGYDSTYYRDYLSDISRITDFWDFSGYNDITLNPYNFYDRTHFYYEVADLMIDTISGKDSYPGFGIHVSRENAAEYVAGRKAEYTARKQEYKKTGTVKLQGMGDESCLVRRNTEGISGSF